MLLDLDSFCLPLAQKKIRLDNLWPLCHGIEQPTSSSISTGGQIDLWRAATPFEDRGRGQKLRAREDHLVSIGETLHMFPIGCPLQGYPLGICRR